jgi:hypothetical protein
MTERKPANMSWESWIDRQIREARERGEFENLKGAGKPIPGLGLHTDELWWIRQLMQREELEYLPPTLALRKAREQVLAKVPAASSEAAVREMVGLINEKIRELNRKPPSDGPPSNLMPIDLESALARWRESQAEDS